MIHSAKRVFSSDEEETESILIIQDVNFSTGVDDLTTLKVMIPL